jgi:hemerythrin-like domain-containing protein
MNTDEISKGAGTGALEVAVAIIKQEHRTLGIVVSSLQQLLAKVAERHAEPDFAFFAAALYYINDFPERYHHPKEDKHLFPVLRRRTHHFDAVMDDLQAEHVRSAQMIISLEHTLVHYQGGAPDGLELFKRAVDAYAAMLRDHMRKEEELLAQAPDYLDNEDWREIAAAFDANDDPLYDARGSEEFGKLYGRIINSLPSKLRSAFRDEAT